MSARRKTKVKRLAFPVSVLVTALLTVNALCIMRCAGVPCHGATETPKLPPCHKDKSSKAPIEPCKQPVLVVAANSFAPAKSAIVHPSSIGVPWAEISFPLHEKGTDVVGDSASPGGSQDLRFSVVLRI